MGKKKKKKKTVWVTSAIGANHRCPGCNKALDALTNISAKGKWDGKPVKGVTVCAYCGCLSVVDEDMTSRIATPEDLIHLPALERKLLEEFQAKVALKRSEVEAQQIVNAWVGRGRYGYER